MEEPKRPKKERIILHVDMDAFFASVEQQSRPYLRGKPIAVIGGGSRTVITTSSYQARSFGVKTGMTVYQARKACPAIHLVTGDNRKYTDTSCRIIEIFQRFTPLVEAFSVDEAFLDITGSLGLFGPPEKIARMIKACIKKRLGLTCSIGIAPNKLLAKLASGIRKPNGLFRIRPEDVPLLMEGLPVEELCGIGHRMALSLARLGIITCGQLGQMPADILSRRFGIIGERLKAMAQGKDESPVIPIGKEPEVKSIGHSMTLEKDLDNKEQALNHLLQLSQMVGRRARAHSLAGRTIALTIRYADFHTFTVRKTISRGINNTHDIWRVTKEILATISLNQPIRLLGISLSNLCLQAIQLPLPLYGCARQEKVCRIMDQINDRFGENTVMWCTLLPENIKGARIISPGWRPQGPRRVEVV